MPQHRTLLIVGFVVAGAAAAVTSGLAVAADNATTTKTLTFKSVQISSHNLAHTARFINIDRDVQDGHYLGNDVFEGTLTKSGVTTTATFALKRGLIYVTTQSNFAVLHGHITGGTGAYEHATGTIRAKGPQDSPTITIKYKT
jgi:hypothetical protein